MATIITREVGATAKGSPLSNNELDSNFINLNNELATKADIASPNFTGTVQLPKLEVTASAGDEGGEIFLNKAQTNTTLVGGVTIDIYQNKLRIFETGGNNRGTFIDLSQATNGVSTNLLANAIILANDIPGLDASKITTGVIDPARLPSYIDDVVEAANLGSFPTIGEAGKIYVALDTNKTYRWSGTTYIFITSGAVDSVAGKTGVVTLVKSDVGLGSVDNTADSTKNVLSASKWTTARTISIAGDATGSAAIDGSEDASITITLGNINPDPGTYTKVTVNSKGLVTGVGDLTSADLPTYTGTLTPSQITTALGFTPYDSTNPSGYVDISGARSSLSFIAGSGSYNPTTGRLTIPTNTNQLANGAGFVTSSGVISVTAGTGLTGGTITSTGTFSLANTTVIAGVYTNPNITVDAQGRITSASSGSSSSSINIDGGIPSSDYAGTPVVDGGGAT